MDFERSELEALKAEVKQLRDIIDSNKQEKRGRPKINEDEYITEHLSFAVTKLQRARIDKILKNKNISLSKFIRFLIFGE